MAGNFVQKGERLLAPAPSGGVVSGSAYLIGSAFGVSEGTAAAGVETVFVTTGVWALPKAAGALALGAAAYWDATNRVVTGTASGNTLIGKVWAAAADAAPTVDVKIG